jgi:hypothetical protein
MLDRKLHSHHIIDADREHHPRIVLRIYRVLRTPTFHSVILKLTMAGTIRLVHSHQHYRATAETCLQFRKVPVVNTPQESRKKFAILLPSLFCLVYGGPDVCLQRTT